MRPLAEHSQEDAADAVLELGQLVKLLVLRGVLLEEGAGLVQDRAAPEPAAREGHAEEIDRVHLQGLEDVHDVAHLQPGHADTALVILPSEYIRRIARARTGILLSTLRGAISLAFSPDGSVSLSQRAYAGFPPLARLDGWRGTLCGIRGVNDSTPCYEKAGRLARPAEAPVAPRTIWYQRPITLADNSYIDQTYRYGSTMGGNFQQHQGVEFNNPDGTPVHAIGDGVVVYAGPAEAGALTVAIRHDTMLNVGRRQVHLLRLLPQLVAGCHGRAARARGRRDQPGREHRPRHQRPPPPRGARRADRRRAPDRGLPAALSRLHHQPRAVDRAAARHRHRGRPGVRQAGQAGASRRASTAS